MVGSARRGNLVLWLLAVVAFIWLVPVIWMVSMSLQPNEVLDEAERKIFAIAESRPKTGGPESVNTLLTKAIDRIDTLFNSDGAITGLSTGFTDLDEMTSGLQPADLIIVAGRPSMGKTTFAMNLVENAVMNSEKAVLVFSLEMPGDSLIMRMLSSLGRIDQTKVRSGRLDDEDWPLAKYRELLFLR